MLFVNELYDSSSLFIINADIVLAWFCLHNVLNDISSIINLTKHVEHTYALHLIHVLIHALISSQFVHSLFLLMVIVYIV